MRRILGFALILGALFVAKPLHAQSNVSIALGSGYSGAGATFTNLNPRGYTGSPQNSPSETLLLNASGAGTLTNLGTGNQWGVLVCKTDGSGCLKATVNVSGAAQDITSTLQANPLGGGGSGGCVPAGTVGQILADSGSGTCSDSLATDNGTALSYAGTGGISAADGPVASASDGTHAGSIQLVGNTTAPTLNANSFGWLGPNSASFTKWFIQPSATGPGSACLPHLGALSSSISAMTCSAVVGADMTANTVTATQLAAQYSKGSCTELWGGSGTSFALTSGDDAVSNNSCYNDSGVTRTITAVKCRSDNASNTTTVNPTFGSTGTGTTILSGALTCGNSLAYSSTGTVSNASWTTGTGITPAMSGTLTGTSIAMIVEYTF